MDPKTCHAALAILLFLSLRSVITSEAASVYFIDSPTHQYLRPQSAQDVYIETDTMLPSEVGAALSVLLGAAPSSTLSAASSYKLNKVLMPNPFDRPRAVIAVEVSGKEDAKLVFSSNHVVSSALFVADQSEAVVRFEEEDEVSVISLNEFLTLDSDSTCSDTELNDFASSFGGSYASADLPLNGLLSIPLASGAILKLDLSKEADREFTISQISFIRSVARVIKMHQDLALSKLKFAELITGQFDGIKVLQEHYGTEGVAQLGLELFVTSISRIFDSLQEAYKGEIVGVIIFNDMAPSESRKLLNMMCTSRSSARLLEETAALPDITAIVETILVRRIVAWTTGLMLVIATLLGIYFLLNMPLTKDTLLYSNVKLD